MVADLHFNLKPYFKTNKQKRAKGYIIHIINIIPSIWKDAGPQTAFQS